MYLLSHEIGRKIRQSLILLCEAHFALLYVLRISLISRTLEDTSSLSMQILSQLGMPNLSGFTSTPIVSSKLLLIGLVYILLQESEFCWSFVLVGLAG